MNSSASTPSLSAWSSVLRGTVGFAAVSLAGFSVWAFAGRWFYTNTGEIGLYVACAVVFLGLSGLLLHPLLRGPESLIRFYKVFIPAFMAYAVVWSVAWFVGKTGLGEWIGSLAGSLVFTALIGRSLGNLRSWGQVAAVMFIAHSAGYFSGGKLMYWMIGPGGAEMFAGMAKAQISLMAKLGWGLLYGLGFGAGLGYGFFVFQKTTKPADDRSDAAE
ncbi:MAG: hypothetical protein H7X97_01105 [Opitutaceae bacterium]|nr:hypothetical protein [Verrucomicrobiales bacterium]